MTTLEPIASPLAIASIASRNLVPLAGALVFGWSAPDLLVLLYVDTLFGLACLLLLVMAHVTGMDAKRRRIETAGDWMKAVPAAVLGALLIGLPLGVPLFIALAEFGWSWRSAVADGGFVNGVAAQAFASALQFVQVHRELSRRADDEPVLKGRTAFLIARWMVVVVAVMTGLPGLLGARLGGLLLVAVYAAGSTYFEIFPGRALRWLNPKEAAADEAAAKARAGVSPGPRR